MELGEGALHAGQARALEPQRVGQVGGEEQRLQHIIQGGLGEDHVVDAERLSQRCEGVEVGRAEHRQLAPAEEMLGAVQRLPPGAVDDQSRSSWNSCQCSATGSWRCCS